ncbi:response regulator transcription factor [Ferruginivarius sediminum]|uniref:DNA-binding response regulator n=1 Tax=Ferruginivarius sediminum TaxID=2661937 RepID=A0A369TED7_9PROT|nr:response regulator transcription factor [Ferruginivarius sediminum]RDD62735.1 DNA-binding response regulator [Ferruginivarius sediminum]
MNRPIDIVIADKSNLVLAGLRQLFSEDGRFRVVATVSDGEQFLQVSEDESFDVGVVGWVMPHLDGRDVLARLRDRQSTAAIVVYTGILDADVPRQVMALGGAAFCSKRESPERLIEIVAAVAQGQMVFPRLDVRALYNDPFDQLTEREMQLLSALAQGSTNGQIAKHLGISLNTVKFHLKNLYEKLRVQNRTGAVALYVGNQVRMR